MYKNILLSRTVWLAIVQGALGIVVAVYSVNPDLGKLMIFKSVLDVILRWLTTEEVRVF